MIFASAICQGASDAAQTVLTWIAFEVADEKNEERKKSLFFPSESGLSKLRRFDLRYWPADPSPAAASGRPVISDDFFSAHARKIPESGI